MEELVRTRPTRIAVDLIDGQARLSTLDQGYHAGGRLMQTDGAYIRIGLLGVNMPLLGGDRAEINVHVGAGVILEVLEPSGMIAYNAKGQRSEYHLNIKVEEGGILVWSGAGFVAARGSNAWRTVQQDLAKRAKVLFKEELVLGRTDENEISLNNRLHATLDGKDILKEELAITPETRKLPGIVGSAKAISTISALGYRPQKKEKIDTHRLELAGKGTIYRSLADAAHLAENKVIPVFNEWKKEVFNSIK